MSDILKPSSEIAKYQKRWLTIRNLLEGSTAIKAFDETYLPRAANGQNNEAYKVYKDEVSFYPATDRTLNGLKGLILSKAPVMEDVPNNVLKLLPEVSNEGDSWADIVDWAVTETQSVTYGGILIDRPTGEADNLKDEEDLGMLPYVAKYPAESILEVRREYNIRRNKKMLSYVRLKEDDQTVRVLKLENNIYSMELWQDNGDGMRLVETVVPKRKKETINRIPFEILSSKGGTIQPVKPLLEDVAELNLEHYRIEGRITYVHYWMSMAILWASGVDNPTPELLQATKDSLVDEDGNVIDTALTAAASAFDNGFKIGGPDAWILQNPQGKVDYAEFKGTGVQSLERKRDKIEDRIAKVGAQVLAAEKTDAESSTTVAMRQQAEQSALAATARTTSRKLTNVLQWLEWWMGVEENALKSTFSLNTDYRVDNMAPQLLTALASDNQRGELSSRTYFDLRQKAGILPETLTWEEELERRDEDALRVPPADDFAPNDDLADDAE